MGWEGRKTGLSPPPPDVVSVKKLTEPQEGGSSQGREHQLAFRPRLSSLEEQLTLAGA